MRTPLLTLLFLCTAPAAQATTLTINGASQITGASGVVVNGSSYTIVMADGTCSALFTGCDADSDFAPLTEQNRLDAQQALVDFLTEVWDQGFGPDDILGCLGTVNQCSVYAPSHINEANPGTVQTVLGQLTVGGLAQGGTQGIDPTQDFASTEVAAWAFVTFTPIPEPGTLLLLSGGLVALAHRRGRSRKRER